MGFGTSPQFQVKWEPWWSLQQLCSTGTLQVRSGHRVPRLGAALWEALLRRRLSELSWLEGSVPASSPEEELEEAPGKAHEWGRLPAQHGAGARRLYRHGTNRSRSRGPARGSSSRGCGALSLHRSGAPCLGETERCIPCREVTLEAAQERPRHVWGEVVPASLPAPSRQEEFFTSGNSDAFLNYFLSRQSSFTVV